MPASRTLSRTAPLLFIVLFFLYFAHPGLHGYFTTDDVMNLQHMHGYFSAPLSRVALDVVNPLTSSYRPLGGLFYRVVYAAVGFHPLPFRMVCFALLIVNLLLAYRLLCALSGSTEAALLATLALSYHAQMFGLYFNSGTIYDILCFTFVTLAMTLYVRCRRKDGGLPRAAWIGLLLLDLLALQSKEMAWTLPVVLLLYELFWHGASPSIPRRIWPSLATGLLTLVPLVSRVLSREGLASSPFYHPTLSVDYWLHNYARYWGLLFYAPGSISIPVMLAMWIAMGTFAVLLRSRAMGFGLLFWILTVFPVSVILARDAFVLYLPALGIALYLGVLADRVRRAVFHERRFSQAGLFLLLAAGLAVAHTRGTAAADDTIRVQRQTRGLVEQLRRLHPKLSPKAHVLFVEEPFGDDWYLGFLLRLLYDDGEISVDRAAAHSHVRPYEYVFRFDGTTLQELPPRLAPCSPAPLISGIADDSSPLLCWGGDWLTEHFPQANETTLTHASDEGATVTLRFQGDVLEYLCTKAYNRGIAEMIIDGVSRGSLDLYSPAIRWQATFPYEHLGPGAHTAVLRVTGRHNPAATDSVVDVDAFKVR